MGLMSVVVFNEPLSTSVITSRYAYQAVLPIVSVLTGGVNCVLRFQFN